MDDNQADIIDRLKKANRDLLEAIAVISLSRDREKMYERALRLMASDYSDDWAGPDRCNGCSMCQGIKDCMTAQYKKQVGLEE